MNALVEIPGDTVALAPAKRRPHARRRILVVDDDADIRQFYFRVLIRHGYQVDAAEDGQAGWRALHAVRHAPESYDLLITDHSMPKLSGVELVKKLRAARMALPVILAAAGTPTNIEELQLAAMLTKPFSPVKLLQTVSEVLHWSTATVNRSSMFHQPVLTPEPAAPRTIGQQLITLRRSPPSPFPTRLTL